MIHARRFLLVTLFILLCSALVSASEIASHPMIGEPAPAFELAEVGGDSLDLAGFRGRFVVIHFGTSW